jgi:hypothetical protein
MSTTQFKDSIEITAAKELKLFVRSMAASYRFIFQQMEVDFVKRADMLELIEHEEVSKLAARFATVPDGDKLVLTRVELYQLYTMMELVCRSFLTEIGDAYKEITMRINKVDEEKYNAVRNVELKIAQTLIQQIRVDFAKDPDFVEIEEKLEMLD